MTRQHRARCKRMSDCELAALHAVLKPAVSTAMSMLDCVQREQLARYRKRCRSERAEQSAGGDE